MYFYKSCMFRLEMVITGNHRERQLDSMMLIILLLMNLIIRSISQVPKVNFVKVFFFGFTLNRGSRWQIFCKIGFHKHFAKLTEKHVYWSLFLIKWQALMPKTKLSSCKFCEVFFKIREDVFFFIKYLLQLAKLRCVVMTL